MINKKILIVITACLLLTSTFAIFPAFSSQPPVNTKIYYMGTIGQPRNVDPVEAYDTASGELIFNVAEPLLFFTDRPYLPAETSKVNASDYASLDPVDITGVIAEGAPYIAPNPTAGATWYFKINTSIIYQDWADWNGTVGTHSNQTVTAEDVLYHFQWMFVYDSPESPEWMLQTPIWGTSGSWDAFDTNPATNAIDPLNNNTAGERLVRDKILNNMWTISNITGEYFAINFTQDWPAAALYQTFAQTWACIEPKDFCIEHGTWNGTFYDGWSADYRRYPSTAASPLDTHTTAHGNAHGSYFGSSGEPALVGTGPYSFTYWDQAGQQWRIDKFAGYHGGWTDGPAGPHVETVIETGVDAWPTRKMMFLGGEFDTAVVPRANMFDLLDGTAADPVHTPLSGIILYYGALGLQNDVMLFDFNVSASSPYVPKKNGVPTATFFADANIRSAFCSAVNFTAFIAAAWYGEASHPGSWYVEGLPYKNVTNEANAWNINAAAVTSYFNAAGVNNFDITLAYNIGNDNRRLFLQNLADNMLAINSTYKVTVVGQDWPTFLTNTHSDQLGGWNVGWLADFADPDNFARTYMHSGGAFSYFQHLELYPLESYVDGQVDLGASTLNTTTRDAIYQNLQWVYKRDAISLPTVQAAGRGWHRDWVRGVYVNQLYPGIYFYDRSKTVAGAYPNVDYDISGSITLLSQNAPWNSTYIYNSRMTVGNGFTPTIPTDAKWNFSVHVNRTDAGLTPILAAVALKRVNSTFAYPVSVIIGLVGGGYQTLNLTWFETGTYVVTGTSTGRDWTMGAQVNTVNGNDTDPNDNLIMTGGTYKVYSGLAGDINGDGIVDIFDAQKISLSFNKKAGDAGYNAAANLATGAMNPLYLDPETGKEIIDVYDAILLAANFNKHMP